MPWPSDRTSRQKRAATAWLRAAYGVLLLAVAATACGGDEDNGKQDVLSAEQVCDGTLRESAQQALRRVSGTDRFTELTGRDASGEPGTFSLELAAKHLHGKIGERLDCNVYRADDDSGHPQLEVEFEPRADRPDMSKDDEHLPFALGVHAYVKGDGGAYLYFSCSTEGKQGKASYVKASMFTVAGVDPASTPKDRMTVLNDVARGLANELGCADEAALPDQVPEPVHG
ncbi:hypothetical protein [Streptomyces sp. NPDC017524]|uniref:hypothetical protein n=1 Tax=unclassified Streptomyces TaxID=2593676 RepID=UPI00379A66DA